MFTNISLDTGTYLGATVCGLKLRRAHKHWLVKKIQTAQVYIYLKITISNIRCFNLALITTKLTTVFHICYKAVADWCDIRGKALRHLISYDTAKTPLSLCLITVYDTKYALGFVAVLRDFDKKRDTLCHF